MGPQRLKVCFIANKCLCSTDDGKLLIQFARSVVSGLIASRGCLKKGTPGRDLYNEARAVVRIVRKGHLDDIRPKDTWLHIGWVNFNSGLITVMVIEPFERTLYTENMRSILLRIKVFRGVHLWDALAHIEKEKDYDGESWEMSARVDKIKSFEPATVLLNRCEPAITFKAWRFDPPQRLPMARGPRDPPAPPDPVEDWGMDNPEDEPDDPDALARRLEAAADAHRRRRAAQKEQRDGPGEGRPSGLGREWEAFSSSSSDNDPPRPIPPPDPPRPLPDPEPPEDQPEDVGEDEGDAEKEEWHKLKLGHVWLVLDPYTNSVGCHCRVHKACRINRNLIFSSRLFLGVDR